MSGGHVVGNFSPHEAFAIGGTNSVRGYEEGAVGSGRSYVVGSGEISFPMVCDDYQISVLYGSKSENILKLYHCMFMMLKSACNCASHELAEGTDITNSR